MPVTTRVEAVGCASCIESVGYDSEYLTLINYPPFRDHGAGDVAAETTWQLKAVRAGRTELRFRLAIDCAPQEAHLPMTITEGDR